MYRGRVARDPARPPTTGPAPRSPYFLAHPAVCVERRVGVLLGWLRRVSTRRVDREAPGARAVPPVRQAAVAAGGARGRSPPRWKRTPGGSGRTLIWIPRGLAGRRRSGRTCERRRRWGGETVAEKEGPAFRRKQGKKKGKMEEQPDVSPRAETHPRSRARTGDARFFNTEPSATDSICKPRLQPASRPQHHAVFPEPRRAGIPRVLVRAHRAARGRGGGRRVLPRCG